MVIRLTQPPYKSTINTWYTKALFAEQALYIADPTIEPVFSLHEDKEGLINAQKTFVEIGDPTGYDWAIKYLGNYNHWIALMRCAWFRDAYDQWLEELNAKMRSEALKIIEGLSSNPEGNVAVRMQASKYMAGHEWDKKTRGRPTKAELVGEMKKLTEAADSTAEDLKRIGLRVINGDKH